jgi:hypothetical protein
MLSCVEHKNGWLDSSFWTYLSLGWLHAHPSPFLFFSFLFAYCLWILGFNHKRQACTFFADETDELWTKLTNLGGLDERRNVMYGCESAAPGQDRHHRERLIFLRRVSLQGTQPGLDDIAMPRNNI